MKYKIVSNIKILFLLIPVIMILVPVWIMLTGTFMGPDEVSSKLGPILVDSNKPTSWTILPDYPTLHAYVELLLDTPKFFVMFWNSVKQVVPMILGQVIISIPAAWGFARFEFKGKKTLFLLYMILMIMPFQVTMVSSYLVLNYFDLIDTHFAIILPGIFSTFPIFITTKFFQSIPEELIEAAKLDGASRCKVLCKIGIPLGSGGIISMVILSFVEYWNALEQPLTFIREKTYWPLSLYLPQITVSNVQVAFIASVIMMAPSVLIFLGGQSYLEQGIVASGIKQ